MREKRSIVLHNLSKKDILTYEEKGQFEMGIYTFGIEEWFLIPTVVQSIICVFL